MHIVWGILYLVVLSMASHLVGELLPRRWFRADRFPFLPYRWERGGKIYDRLKIKKWKTKVPDLSCLFRYMTPKRVVSYQNTTASDWDRLVRETCVAEWIHVMNSIVAVFVIFIMKNVLGVIFYVLYVLGNIPFIMIQRYNRPNLVRVKEKMAAREKCLQEAE